MFKYKIPVKNRKKMNSKHEKKMLFQKFKKVWLISSFGISYFFDVLIFQIRFDVDKQKKKWWDILFVAIPV